MGAPTEGMTLDAIRNKWGRVTDFLSKDAAGTDDTEYAVLCAKGILQHGASLTSAQVADIWLDAVAQQNGGFYGAGFSEMIGLSNLGAGLRPPHSGQRNNEMWSDGAAMRVAPIGIYAAGNPSLALELAQAEASVSHSLDGIFAAQAMAAGVATAMVSDAFEPVITAIVAALPSDSWSRRLLQRALDLVEGVDDPVTAERLLYDSIPIRHYIWADIAPEALALAIALFKVHKGQPSVIESGVNIGRDSDTIAAMAGALAGALSGEEAFPLAWRQQVQTVTGRCITATKGTDLLVLADQLVARAERDQEKFNE
jgi:ADP-ribosylglycohydrolase